MLKYREDLEKVVTKEEIEKRNEIVDKTNERGWFFKKEAKFLLSFEGKARVCNTCGRTLRGITNIYYKCYSKTVFSQKYT